MLQIGLKPLMKLFQSHAVYNGTQCYRDFIHKVKIELLKEKLLNRDLKIRRRRRQRERHKSNRFN